VMGITEVESQSGKRLSGRRFKSEEGWNECDGF